MIRYEATLNGGVEPGEPFTNFNELRVLEEIFDSLNWNFQLLQYGRGGYYLFQLNISNSKPAKLHVYLKRVTFGGRANLQYEKRAQFSASIEREGFINANQETDEEYSLILGIYKNEKFDDVIICAWDIHEWGHNIGRAFNCFVNVKAIASAYKNGFSQHKSSKGQIACCFKPEKFQYYLDNRQMLHEAILAEKTNSLPVFTSLIDNHNNSESDYDYRDTIPKYPELFQLTIDILKQRNGIASTDTIELDVAKLLKLTQSARLQIHNEGEGYRTELGYQLAWSRFYLRKAGFITNPKRTIWSLTDLSWESLIDKREIVKKAIENDVLKEINEETLFSYTEDSEIEEELNTDSGEIHNPFDPNKVDIRTRSMTLDLILKRLNTDAINMNTSFQRNANLWNVTKQSRLIESILVKFPLPAFYFDGSLDENWLVVDGLQRLSSLDNYVNKEAFALTNLEFLSQFNNHKFSELPGHLQRRIEEFEITAYVIAAGTPTELKFNVFKRINTGGLTLTSQEIRNALYQGRAVEFVKKLANFSSFKIATDYSISEDRLLDQEFITRFLAFYIFELADYDSDLDGILNRTLDFINSNPNLNTMAIEEDFKKSMNAAYQIFGDNAFRKKYFIDDRKKPINKALFDAWAVLLSKLNANELAILANRKDLVLSKFMHSLNTDEEFVKSITSGTGDKSRVRKRFNEIKKIIDTTILA